MRHYNRSRRTELLAQYWLWIGYYAWQGYLTGERGIVVVSSDLDLVNVDLSDDRLPNLNFRYIPQSQLSPYLQEWLVPVQALASILVAVADYQPDTELVFALGGTNVDIGWCQRLKTPPPDCYQQLRRRWSEFDVEIGSGER